MADRLIVWSAERMGETLDAIREGLQVISTEWRYLYVNAALCRQGQRAREELVGKTMMEAYPGIETTQMFSILRDCMVHRRSLDFENEFVFASGERRWFELRVQPVPEGIAVLSLDITDRKSLEVQMRAAQKMEAVGRLAGGGAHDFNNILTAIRSFGDFALKAISPDHAAHDDIKEVLIASSRAEALVAQLLAFSRRRIIEPKVLDINEALRGLGAMLRRILGEDIELVTVLSPSVGRVKIDPGALEQVLVNLAVNSRDAMPAGGRLTIETSEAVLDESYQMTKGGTVRPGSYVVVAVTDGGEGMTEEVLAHLFEPFFTTKALGRGTGLGLSTCYGIVKQASGYLWVYSEPGVGTTFKIYLPREDAPLSVITPPPPGSLVGGTETLLVVDDDPQIRALVARSLGMAGYRVLTASSPHEALAIEKSIEGPLQLLLTDVILPQMGGRDLAERLCERRPALKVLFMSGYTENAIVHQGVLEPGIALLQKPFDPEILSKRIREVLDA